MLPLTLEPLKNLIPMKFDLNNKVAIVTGASQGIGETIAVEMANSGAYVICLARNKDALDSTINIIEKNGFNLTSSYTIDRDIKRVFIND